VDLVLDILRELKGAARGAEAEAWFRRQMEGLGKAET
jgi:hypothetical protein